MSRLLDNYTLSKENSSPLSTCAILSLSTLLHLLQHLEALRAYLATINLFGVLTHITQQLLLRIAKTFQHIANKMFDA